MPVGADAKKTCYPSCIYPLMNAEYLSSAIRCPGVEDVAICGIIQSIGLTDNFIGTSTGGERKYYDTPHPLDNSFYLSLDDPKAYRFDIKLFGRCGIENLQKISICSVSTNNDVACSLLTCGNTTIIKKMSNKVFVNYTKQ